MQGIVTQVGCCGNLMGGDAQDQLLVVAPGEQEAAGREAENAVLLWRRLQRQLLQLLHGQCVPVACDTQPCGASGATLWAALGDSGGSGDLSHPGCVQQLQHLIPAGGVQGGCHPCQVA